MIRNTYYVSRKTNYVLHNTYYVKPKTCYVICKRPPMTPDAQTYLLVIVPAITVLWCLFIVLIAIIAEKKDK